MGPENRYTFIAFFISLFQPSFPFEEAVKLQADVRESLFLTGLCQDRGLSRANSPLT